MDKGLCNFQISKFFKDKENEEIKKHYMGVYSIDKITRYINFYEIIKKKKTVNILLQYLIRTNLTNQEHAGGVLWIFTPRRTYFYSTHLE